MIYFLFLFSGTKPSIPAGQRLCSDVNDKMVLLSFSVSCCLFFLYQPFFESPNVDIFDIEKIYEVRHSLIFAVLSLTATEEGVPTSVQREVPQPQDLTRLPFQVQFSFTSREGGKYLRVITNLQDTTRDREEAEDGMCIILLFLFGYKSFVAYSVLAQVLLETLLIREIQHSQPGSPSNYG
mgnify:CR=1 FL=1